MTSFYWPKPIDYISFSILGFLLVSNLLLLQLKRLNANYFNRWVFGTFATVFFFAMGLVLSNSRIEEFNPNHFSNYLNSDTLPEAYIGIIVSEPEIKPKSIKAVVEVTEIQRENIWIPTSGKILVYFKPDTEKTFKYGDEINFLKAPENILPPANFDEFNYKRYLNHHYIYQRLYLANSDYKLIGFKPIWYLKEKAINWRNFLLNRYTEYGIDGNELAILSALTLGKKESITPSLKSAYSSAGAMHVLAVSGLHVGIIFLVLRFLLGWMDKLKYGSIIKAILLIISIWFYAFITGLSPSVIRASTMFTFMIIAVSFKRKSNIYNTLALSAFAILIYEPFMLLEVGFQLSYLAVIGIIYLHPYLYALIEIPPGITEKAWNITCVSLSAQLVTAPLGILYFPHFPTSFLLSNLIVIPGAFLIIFLAIGFQIISIIPFVGEPIAFVLKWVVTALNWLVQKMELLPSALISGLDISVIETWLMYLFIASVTIWLTQYSRKFVLYTLVIVFLLVSSQTIEKWNQLNQKEITFYHTGKQAALEFINGLDSQFHADTSLINNTDKMQFYVYHHRWKRGLETRKIKAVQQTKSPISVLGNTTVLTIDNEHLFTPNQVHEAKPNILYVNTYKDQFIKELSQLNYQPKIIIGPASSRKVIQQLTLFCQTKKWEFYTIKEVGAIKVKLNEKLKPESFSHQRLH